MMCEQNRYVDVYSVGSASPDDKTKDYCSTAANLLVRSWLINDESSIGEMVVIQALPLRTALSGGGSGEKSSGSGGESESGLHHLSVVAIFVL